MILPPPPKRVPPARKHLSVDALYALLRLGFEKVPDPRGRKCPISLTDALMSAFAMFSLKDPSLLAFEERRNDENMRNLFGIARIPSDTHMREILDLVEPRQLRPLFNDVFRQLQRGKALEPFVFYQGCYLLSVDGTGYFSSSAIHCDSCLEKVNKQTQEVTYQHQMLAAVMMHPDHREVIPLAPEPIQKQDGSEKNDCEHQRGQTLAPANPPGASPPEADRRGGRTGEQRPAHPRTAGPRHALHPGRETWGPSLPLRPGARRVGGRPGDDAELDRGRSAVRN